MSVDESSSKNMILAVALAVITSITSLGTALITKDNGDFDTFKQKVEEELKLIKKDIADLDKKDKDFQRYITTNNDRIDKKIKKLKNCISDPSSCQ